MVLPNFATVRVAFDSRTGTWLATINRGLQVAYGGASPTEAARRLLEGFVPPDGEFNVECTRDCAAGVVVRRAALWQAGRLAYVCPDCAGRKLYVGLNESSPCPRCEGQGIVADAFDC